MDNYQQQASGKPPVINVERIDKSEESPSPDKKEKIKPAATGWERNMWWVVAIVSAIWAFPLFLEPTDLVVPFGGPFGIDEILASGILLTALHKLGIRVPFLNKYLEKYLGKVGKPGEKDVTPGK